MPSPPPPLPPTMKAWTSSRAGPPRQVLSQTLIPTPSPPTGDQVLIKIAYAGVNPGDTKIMRLLPWFLRAPNSVRAMDFSGTILSRGALAPPHLVPGARVFGMLGIEALFQGLGTLCEYICISASKHMIAVLPSNMSLEEGGCVAIAAYMAYLICKKGGIAPDCGYRILVNGASGGCGSMFVQAGVAMGAREIVGVCSAPNAEMVEGLGASRTVDYRTKRPLHGFLAEEYGHRKFDFVLDTMGDQELYTHSPGFLKEGGVFMNIGDYTHGTFWTMCYWGLNCAWPVWLGGTPRRYIMFGGDVPKPEGTEWVRDLVEKRQLKAVIDKSMGFDEALEALELLDTRRARGRVVVKVSEE